MNQRVEYKNQTTSEKNYMSACVRKWVDCWHGWLHLTITVGKGTTNDVLLRNVMPAQYMLSSCVCLCVCHLPVLIKMTKLRIMQTMPHNSPGTLVFWSQKSERNLNGSIKCIAFHIFIVGEHRDFKFGVQVEPRKSQPTDNNLSPKGAWSHHITKRSLNGLS